MIVLFTATLIDSELFLLSSKHVDFFGHFIGPASGGLARARAGAGGQIHARLRTLVLILKVNVQPFSFDMKKHFPSTLYVPEKFLFVWHV